MGIYIHIYIERERERERERDLVRGEIYTYIYIYMYTYIYMYLVWGDIYIKSLLLDIYIHKERETEIFIQKHSASNINNPDSSGST